MAGWSTVKDESDLDDVEIVQTSKRSKNSSTDLDSPVIYGNGDDSNERLRSLFDRVLLVFLKEGFGGKKGKRPIPALFSNGQRADLFKLFWVVWNRGGYGPVSKNGLWATVTEECELDGKIMESVMLVYVKYLYELDRFLRKALSGQSFENGEGEGGKLGFLLLELHKKFTGGKQMKLKHGELIEFERKSYGRYYNSDIRDVNKVHDDVEKTISGRCYNSDIRDVNKVPDNVEKTISDDDDEKSFPKREVSVSKKRKRDSTSLSAMVNWVVEIAKHPDDLAIGEIPEYSKWKDHSKEELWVQALLARQARLTRKCATSPTEECGLQKKLKMHPSMYEDGDNLSHQSPEKLRSSERVPSVMKPRICPCCNSRLTFHNVVVTPLKAEVENIQKEQALPNVEVLETNGNGCSSKDEHPRKYVCVGPFFQAEVPEWTGVVSESDPKWLGSRMWPLENGKHSSGSEIIYIGEGRKHSCECQLPGSVACVRFHIAENRLKLRREIGLLFYHWGFHRMGEELSLSWTVEEEKRFKLMVRLNLPSLNTRFWGDIVKFFPYKAKEKLVNYYFNVFLIARRAYQNRVTPKDINSDDDDESEFGCVGGRYGYEAPSVRGSDRLICAENKQCTDF